MSQIRIRARDNGTPFRFNTTVCVVTITRNFQAPVFGDLQYSAVVPETFPLGDVILTVTATDADPLVRLLLFTLNRLLTLSTRHSSFVQRM